ncbi:DUF262 domain-containing protein [Microbacterium sp. LRZ72]|uniref:DUF262 domain-containing protein n=1 Tax=Microbacterium sp. LRZ72 TaxID=2942481 RepID=UPI0029A3FD23|nr:DUF262 domain-containing protein [Microbacterium sp. LRZ72]MDX2375190.1 DUF262 domain-containing protein [Microbacterium sp. LRZ72]
MKAVDANLLQLLKKSERFVVPIYQRVYSWGEAECAQLWNDLVRAGVRTHLNNHFTGSIVYIERDQGTTTSREPDLIIDGQQRVTTVTLLLAALAARLEELPEQDREPVPGFAPQKIRGLYLTNQYESGDDYFKLLLTQRDKDALKAVVRNAPLPDTASRVVFNYDYFLRKLREPGVDLVAVCLGLDKLVVVDVKLTRGMDDPQLVFESMNATGKKLSQADLIRNFVLMDLPPTRQERLYEDYWFPMEREFQGSNEKRFDEFVRHYLTMKSNTNAIPRIDEIYDAFKAYAFRQEADGVAREELVVDLSRHASWFAAMALGTETDPRLARRFAEIDLLATVVYPFQLHLYGDYVAGRLPTQAFAQILDVVISYVFRRAVCRIPTNSLNKTFATLASAIDPDNYVEGICARLLTLPDYRRFPTDEEFEESLKTTDMYSIKRRAYFFRKMENYGRKEEVSIADYTIEHIMPQNANTAWQTALGDDWQVIHDRYLHALGNLTLTGYNPEYSDRPFLEKRDMAGGFKDSPLRLNQGIGQLDRWGAAEIEQRASSLAVQAARIWPRPVFDEMDLAYYQRRFSDSRRFDWSLAHAILEVMPDGKWTNYDNLAEAVGTSAQPMANHLASCTDCSHAYRVLTYNGTIADNFRWIDPGNDRDPVAALQADGIRFSDGRADPEQRLDAEELLELVEEPAL